MSSESVVASAHQRLPGGAAGAAPALAQAENIEGQGLSHEQLLVLMAAVDGHGEMPPPEIMQAALESGAAQAAAVQLILENHNPPARADNIEDQGLSHEQLLLLTSAVDGHGEMPPPEIMQAALEFGAAQAAAVQLVLENHNPPAKSRRVDLPGISQRESGQLEREADQAVVAFRQAEAQSLWECQGFPPVARPKTRQSIEREKTHQIRELSGLAMKAFQKITQEVQDEMRKQKCSHRVLAPILGSQDGKAVLVTGATGPWVGCNGVYNKIGKGVYKNVTCGGLVNAMSWGTEKNSGDVIELSGNEKAWHFRCADASLNVDSCGAQGAEAPLGRFVFADGAYLADARLTEPCVRVLVTSQSPIFNMPPAGLLVPMAPSARVQDLLDAVAADLIVHTAIAPGCMQLCHGDKDLDCNLSLNDLKQGVHFPLARKYSDSNIEVSLSLEVLPEPMRDAIAIYVNQGYVFIQADLPAPIMVTNEELINTAKAVDRLPTMFTVHYDEGHYAASIRKGLIKFTALTNTTVEDLMESECVKLRTAGGQDINIPQLADKAGQELRDCFPLYAQYLPSAPGKRIKAPPDVCEHIESLMNKLSGGRRYSVAAVLINHNDLLWQKYAKFKDGLAESTRQGRRIARAAAVRTAALNSACFDRLDGKLNEVRLFHGTVIENAASIVGESFKLHRSSQGAFGPGVYFADHPDKSNSYARSSGGLRAMLLSRVALGNFRVVQRTGDYKGSVVEAGSPFDSVLGTCFTHPEYIIYREEQCYPEYVILYRKL